MPGHLLQQLLDDLQKTTKSSRKKKSGEFSRDDDYDSTAGFSATEEFPTENT